MYSRHSLSLLAAAVALALPLAAHAQQATDLDEVVVTGTRTDIPLQDSLVPAQVITRGDPFLPPAIVALGRSPRGHPEGLREAFANIYGEMAQERIARNLGERPPALPYPRIEDGAHTMAFIEACIRSSDSGRWEDVAR